MRWSHHVVYSVHDSSWLQLIQLPPMWTIVDSATCWSSQLHSKAQRNLQFLASPQQRPSCQIASGRLTEKWSWINRTRYGPVGKWWEQCVNSVSDWLEPYWAIQIGISRSNWLKLPVLSSEMLQASCRVDCPVWFSEWHRSAHTHSDFSNFSKVTLQPDCEETSVPLHFVPSNSVPLRKHMWLANRWKRIH